MRHRPLRDTSGWYVWARQEFSDDERFFQPTHVGHVVSLYPEIRPYLALPPGWRFLIEPGYEDVWFDEALLVIDE
jgi:hypothetical protein